MTRRAVRPCTSDSVDAGWPLILDERPLAQAALTRETDADSRASLARLVNPNPAAPNTPIRKSGDANK